MRTAPGLPTRGLCSVVIPTRDEGAMLVATVASVLDESAYASLEMVVVDDARSTAAATGSRPTGGCGYRVLGAPAATVAHHFASSRRSR